MFAVKFVLVVNYKLMLNKTLLHHCFLQKSYRKIPNVSVTWYRREVLKGAEFALFTLFVVIKCYTYLFLIKL